MGHLTYFSLNHPNEKPPFEVEFFLRNGLRDVVYQLKADRPCVYLICDGEEIYVTDNIERAIKFCTELNQVQIQEWESFEDAYAVALNMKENHPLCFDNRYKLN